MDFIFAIKGVLCTGGKVSIFQKSQRFFNGFWCEYGCIKRDKTDNIVSLVVKIVLKHKNKEILYILFKKVTFEQLKLCHLERIAFHWNFRWSCRKYSLKIVAWSVNPFRVSRSLKSIV